MEKHRCWGKVSPLMEKYHDEEWGIPLHDEKRLFEFLLLDGAQAGLSWNTILNKRENFRSALDNFDYSKIAQYDETKKTELMANPGIIRNRLKIESFSTNARAFMAIQKEFGSFDTYLWNFVNGVPIQNSWISWSEVPAKSDLSERISKDLKKRGFKFIGATIVYAFMQAIGMVNDHLDTCFRYEEIKNIGT
ncbi:MAG: DNA-3-methyladenine glycosylase I [Promethearchaeota archaeon]|nr:MAG: DNA-3-methyladenine glycosylase I [Candidatus Lokiarchaeota archaeon]